MTGGRSDHVEAADLPSPVGEVMGGVSAPPRPRRPTGGSPAEGSSEADLPAVARPKGAAGGLGAPPPPPRRRQRDPLPELADIPEVPTSRKLSPDEAELVLPSLAEGAVPTTPEARVVGGREARGKGTVPLGTAPASVLGSMGVAGAAATVGLRSVGEVGGDADLPAPVAARGSPPMGGQSREWDSVVPDGGLDLPALGGGLSELDFDLGEVPNEGLPALPSAPPVKPGAAKAGDPDLPSVPSLYGVSNLPQPVERGKPGGGRTGGSSGPTSDLDLLMLGGAALPALSHGLDLPALGERVDLPSPLTGSGSDEVGAGLPVVAESSLPALAEVALPTIGGVGLPRVEEAGLPRPGTIGLPTPGVIAPQSAPKGVIGFAPTDRPGPEEFDLPPPGGLEGSTLPEGGGGSLPPTLGFGDDHPFGDLGGDGFSFNPSLTDAPGDVDPFAASVPPPPSGPPPQADPVEIIRQVDGGTGYGEVNLGGDDLIESPIEEEAPPPSEDQHPDDMEFGAIPQEDGKPDPEADAVHARMAIGAKIAPTSGEVPRRRRGLRYAIALLVLGVGGGGALSLTPHGPFGWYYLERILRGSEHQALLESSIVKARSSLASDTYPAARVALRDIQGARNTARRVPGIAAYAVFVESMYELRFGADSEANARAKVTLEEMAQSTDVPFLELARAANEAVAGQLARSISAVERLARAQPEDIDVLVLRGEVTLLGTKPIEAVAAWQEAADVESSARTAFGLARAHFAHGKPSDAEQHARRAIELSPQHVGARILLARVAWTVREDETTAMKLLDEAAKHPEAASVPEQVLLNTLNGDIHLVRSRISLAEAAFGRALKLDPKAAGALRGLGEALYQAGRFSDALSHFEAGTKANPDLLDVQIGVAKTLLALERFEDAKPMLAKLDEKHPKRFEVAYWHGVALDAVGDRDAAEAALRRAIANGGVEPQVVHAYTKLALLLGGKGENEQARRLLDEAGQKLPRSPALHRALGDLALQQGVYDDALAHFQKARTLAPHDMGVLFSIGVTQRRERNFDAALDTFDKVAEVDRDYPGLALERGLVFEAAGRNEDALKAYEAALAKAPDDVDLKLRVGCGKAAAGRGVDAEKLLREVLAVRSASAETNHCMGRAILAKGADITLALRHLERATDLDPHRAEYHLYVGLAALEAGRIPQAEAALRRALELDQSLADAYWQRGVLRYRQGQVKDAVADLGRALALRPSRYEAHAALADAFLDLQQEDRATAEWAKAIEADPDNALWRFRYGKILAARSQNDAAQLQLSKALDIAERAKPGPNWLWEAHMLLARSLGQNPRAVEHWVKFLRSCPQDNPYKSEAIGALKTLGAPWDGD